MWTKPEAACRLRWAVIVAWAADAQCVLWWSWKRLTYHHTTRDTYTRLLKHNWGRVRRCGRTLNTIWHQTHATTWTGSASAHAGRARGPGSGCIKANHSKCNHISRRSTKWLSEYSTIVSLSVPLKARGLVDIELLYVQNNTLINIDYNFVSGTLVTRV